ncbi:MAG: HDOD domain-containing protein [Deltaproteobacteria bacterium]|nr:HDOD domain-containing protein [Deltaproteobacteria bacterium]
MEIYLARQPIFDKNKKIYGYELLFRDGMANIFPNIDGDEATSKILSNTFFSIGLDQIVSDKKAFINFTKELLIKKIPTIFPKANIVVEILEDVEPDDDVIESCSFMAKQGYEIALDDFFYEEKLIPLISIANIIKFDFRLTPPDHIRNVLRKLTPYHLTFLAEKIETYEEFNEALKMGFSYFQGYFFSKPEIMKGRDIPSYKINYLQILSEMNKENFRFSELEKIINRDISISYKLLKYLNSAFFGRPNKISSIKDALILLGESGIKQFISVIAAAGLASDKPDELIRSSIVRAKLCELLGSSSKTYIDKSELFIVGLFSQLDAMLDNKMETLLIDLPLSDNVKKALISREGELGDYLNFSSCYEKGSWNTCSILNSNMGIDEKQIPKFYLEAVTWAETYTKL